MEVRTFFRIFHSVLLALSCLTFAAAGASADEYDNYDGAEGHLEDAIGATPLYDADDEPPTPQSVSLEKSTDLSESLVSAGGCDAGCGGCDCCGGKVAKAVAGSHKGVFYNNNFNYVCDPCYDGWYPGDELKRLGVGDLITFDVGGQYRMRQHNENNFRTRTGGAAGITGADDSFMLQRTRLFANAQVGRRFRVSAEMIDAVSIWEDFAPRPIEENRTDVLNLFGDVMLLDGNCGELWGRYGRQELVYGAQRVISPLDWANTRRTFEGGKMFYKGQSWDVDAFWVKPVAPVTNRLDGVNQNQEWMGLYTTYKDLPIGPVDLYYLRYNGINGAFNYNTFGGRYNGSYDDVWLMDLETDYQYGQVGGVGQLAGAYTVGLGRKFPCVKWTPTFWAYYDWASGDANRGTGYHHQFPLAHKYNGFMDLFGRRNLEDINFLLTARPHKKVKLLAWWHIFQLQNSADIPYNVVMGAQEGVTVAGGSPDLGQELDLLASIAINPRLNLLFGYSHFFTGDFYRTNTSPGLTYTGDADFFYTQAHVNF